MKIEIEDLIRDRASIKEEVSLLERTQALADLEKLKLEEKLRKNQRKCEELEETINRLNEEKRVSSDREKRAEEWYDKLSTQNSQLVNEKNKLIFELNEKINELKNKNSESERLVGVYREKCKCLDIRVVKMGQEIEDLRRKQMEVDKVVEELRRENFEANRTIDELKLKKAESDKAAEVNKSRLENLSPRIVKIGEALADMLNVKVGYLATSEEWGNFDFPEFKGKKDGSGNSSMPDDAETTVAVSKKGDRNLVQPKAREDIADTVNTSPGSHSGNNPHQGESNRTVQDNERKGPQGSGAHASGTRLIFGEARSRKIACSSFPAGDIIEIIDSDDETNADNGSADSSNRRVGSNVGENEMNFEKFVQSPSSSQRSKRNRADDFLANSATKRKRNTRKSDEDNISINEKENQVLESTHDRIRCSSSGRSQTPLEKFNGLIDEDSTDSDESCTDSRMDDLIASLWKRKWLSKADMLQAFCEDEELCMNAVCALYRQQFFAGKSTERSNLSKNGGLISTVDAMSGRALAEYLIDGDKDLRLRKSVSEVKKQRPEVINDCRKLATVYQEKLYEIYCEEEDPFFGPT